MLCQATFKYLRERAETFDKNPFWYWGDFENFEIAGVNNTRVYYTFEEQEDTAEYSNHRNHKDAPLIYPREGP